MSAIAFNPSSIQTSVHYGLNLESQIGNTPLIGFHHLTRHLPPNVQVYAKAEWVNPGGSVKDRAALNIVRTAMASGHLGSGQTLVDSTSGNTGIAYAMLGAAMGFKVKLFMPENVSRERTAILRAYGAELTYTDPLEGSDGAIEAVRDFMAHASSDYFYADQYNNPANWQAHYNTTAREIWWQTCGQITHFVTGIGTTGTLIGTGRRLHEFNPYIQVIGMQPESPFHGLEGLKHISSSIRPDIYDESVLDHQMTVATEEAYDMARRLSREEGYLVGISAAANFLAALRVAEHASSQRQAATIVTVFCDNGYKYLSDPLWDKA